MEHADRKQIAWWIGLVAHLAVFFWYAASTLLAPPWAVVGLLLVWAVLLVVGVRQRRTRPLLMLLIPVLDAVVWVVVISLGDALLDWTA